MSAFIRRYASATPSGNPAPEPSSMPPSPDLVDPSKSASTNLADSPPPPQKPIDQPPSRKIHVDNAAGLRKDESKVELSMKLLKVDEEAIKVASKSIKPAIPSIDKFVDGTSIREMKELTPPAVKKTIRQRVLAELSHYFNGFKLLFIDIGVCYKYVLRVCRGHSLTRRERKQLVRTTADIFRLVPFLVFIIVPFMEFLLPVALKLFPNMLPSTFQTQSKKVTEKMRTILKGKLEMAKFLQDTIEETAVQRKGAKGDSVAQFVEFMEKIRKTGVSTSNEDILRYSKLFEDEITLDNLRYNQLSALCQLIEIPTVGPAALLRFQIRLKLRQLEADDCMIVKEGIDSLDESELQEANRQRGMRSLGVPMERLKLQLTQWLDLHRIAEIPASLLLLSRTLYLPETLSAGEQLKATIKQLPQTTMEEAKITISEVTGDRIDNVAKLNIIKTEELAIQGEFEEKNKISAELANEKSNIKADNEKTLPKTAVIADCEILKDIADNVTPEKFKETPIQTCEILKDTAKSIIIDNKEKLICTSDLENLEDALEKVADEKRELQLEQSELAALKEDVSEYKENLEDLKETSTISMNLANGDDSPLTPITESKGATRLTKQVNRLITQMDYIVDTLSREKVELIENIEHSRHVSPDSETVNKQLVKEQGDLIGINELLDAVQKFQNVSEDSQLKYVLEVLDQDKDGAIDINDALKVVELLGRENIHINSLHMKDIIRLLELENKVDQNN